MDKPGMVLVVESSSAMPHVPLETLEKFGLKVQVVHTSREAITTIWLNQPIVVFLAESLDDGETGIKVQAAIRVAGDVYKPSVIALDREIEPSQVNWRLNRDYPNLAANTYTALKTALIACGFNRVLLVENPRTEVRIPERVFAPARCVLVDTRYTAQSARDAVWRDQHPIIILDERLGAGTTGEDFLRALAVIKGYSPIVIGLAESLATQFHVTRGSDFEIQLGLVLSEASDQLERNMST